MDKILKMMKTAGFPDAGICAFSPELLLDGKSTDAKIDFTPKTVICGVIPYYKIEKDGQNLSIYAVSRDYHLVVGEAINKAEMLFKKEFPGFCFKGFCDNSPVSEVKAALNSGLGARGQNNLLIHPKYGSFVNLCAILTDMPVSFGKVIPKSCEDCGKCAAACPGGALTKAGFVRERCLSHISQKKGELTSEERSLLKKGNKIWGCDICQTVCPHNKNLNEAATQPPHFSRLAKEDIEELTDREFKEKYKETAFTWRGKAVLLRNIGIMEEK